MSRTRELRSATQAAARGFAAIALIVGAATPAAAQVELMDDKVLTSVAFDELEFASAGGDTTLRWDGDIWTGTDINRLWIKTDGERRGGRTEDAALELLMSRAIKPFWDLQAGLRREFRPTPDQDWLAVGLRGLAPYWYSVDASFYLADGGQTALRVEADYELLLSQRLILEPSLDLTAYGQTDARRGIGGGLSELELGLRLRYEIRREFAPYAGIRYARRFGTTADPEM